MQPFENKPLYVLKMLYSYAKAVQHDQTLFHMEEARLNDICQCGMAAFIKNLSAQDKTEFIFSLFVAINKKELPVNEH